ncbi:MAG: hypothetical protein E7612_07310 [Ruminococcaceae bacterium]|nr:hypothetical protein [Oscillospiraceae bacterium]
MKITLQNNAVNPVKVVLGDVFYNLQPQEKALYISQHYARELNITLYNSQGSSVEKRDEKLFYSIKIDTKAILQFSSEETTLLINSTVKKFQNYTQYEYFHLQGDNIDVLNSKYYVNNNEEIQSVYLQNRTGRKKSLLILLITSLLDTLIDFGLLSIGLGLVFGFWVGLISFLSLFVIVLLLNTFSKKLEKSKHRIFNWAKDDGLTDDVSYFIDNVDKYCE